MQAFKNMEININSYDVDNMSKMADIPIFGKKYFEIFYPGTSGTIRRSLICTPDPTVCSNYDTVLSMTYFRQGQILQLRLLYNK